jgi:hypothetical protein
MKKEFIPYEQALALKELGFDEPCIRYYWTDSMFSKTYNEPFNYSKKENTISAPLYQQAFRWFREKYVLHPHICYLDEFKVWHYDIYKLAYGLWTKPERRQNNTYEEAELECLKKLIEIIKEK